MCKSTSMTNSNGCGKQPGRTDATTTDPQHTENGPSALKTSQMAAVFAAGISAVSAQAATQNDDVYIRITSLANDSQPTEFACALPVTSWSAFFRDVAERLSRIEDRGAGYSASSDSESVRCQGDDGQGCRIPHEQCLECDDTGSVYLTTPVDWEAWDRIAGAKPVLAPTKARIAEAGRQAWESVRRYGA